MRGRIVYKANCHPIVVIGFFHVNFIVVDVNHTRNTWGIKMYFLVLVKLFKKYEHARKFLDGVLHCNRVNHFRREYDDLEGIATLPTEKAVMKITDNKTGKTFEIRPENWAGPMRIDSDRLKNAHAFCMYSMTNKDYGPVTRENFHEIKDLVSIPLVCFESFGLHAVVVYSVNRFFKRFAGAAKSAIDREEIIHTTGGFVKYYDSEKPPEDMHLALDDEKATQTLMYKDRKFKDEREFRFLIETGTVGEDAFDLPIGDIRDIAYYAEGPSIPFDFTFDPSTK